MSADAGMLKRFNKFLLDRGILKGGQKFYMSLAHNEADIQRTTEVFKEAAEAYGILGDPEKRAVYDQYGRAGLKGGPP